MGLAAIARGKGKKGHTMTDAQRAVAQKLAAHAKRIVGYPSRAL